MRATAVGVLLTVVTAAAIVAWQRAPSIAADALLRPARRAGADAAPDGCSAIQFNAGDVMLKGWRCGEPADALATIVLLHGVADNRASWRGAIPGFIRQRFEVVAYDSRGHGESGGAFCTYGFLEKRDLRRVIDIMPPRPVVLIGASLGGAVALQEAADDPRVTAVVAAETFSDLRTVAAERAPFVLTSGVIRRAFAIAEQRGLFSVDEVSPVRAAARTTVPVLLVHGADDRETPPDHSRRIYAALAGPKRLLLVPGAGHNGSLGKPGVWDEVERWLRRSFSPSPRSTSTTGTPGWSWSSPSSTAGAPSPRPATAG